MRQNRGMKLFKLQNYHHARRRYSKDATIPAINMFVQDGPRHQNMFDSDGFLLRSLQRLMPEEVLRQITPDLQNFGKRVSTDIWKLGQVRSINKAEGYKHKIQ